jgi:hypothetical protein
VTYGHDSVDLPLTWLRAEEAACALIAARRPGLRKASFEFRATHHVLALTVMLADAAKLTGNVATHQARILQGLLADDVEWAVWCQGQLDDPAPELTVADTELASCAWRWLTHSRLLGGSFQEPCSPCAAVASFRGVGVALGVAQSRGVLEGSR